MPVPRHAATRSRLQTPTFWVDESGSRGSAGKGYVVAALKTRRSDELSRAVFAVRERHEYGSELKFNRISERHIRVFDDLAETLADSDAHLVATVVANPYNPFKGQQQWEVQADLISQLVFGGLNRSEVATVLMDKISTPVGTSIGDLVKRGVNSRCRDQGVVSAISLDSQASDMLQLADLLAGAIRYHRFEKTQSGSTSQAKRRVVRRFSEALGVEDLSDGRHDRVNILTLSGKSRVRQFLPPTG